MEAGSWCVYMVWAPSGGQAVRMALTVIRHMAVHDGMLVAVYHAPVTNTHPLSLQQA